MSRTETSPAFLNSTISFSGFVTNYGEIHLLSIFVPSSTSIVISRKDDDSIGKTPSESTLSVASTILIPMNLSFLIDVEATNLVSILHSKVGLTSPTPSLTHVQFGNSFSLRKPNWDQM